MSGSTRRHAPSVGGTGFDGNRDPDPVGPVGPTVSTLNMAAQMNKNVDVGGGSWGVAKSIPVQFCSRDDKPSTLGREVMVGLNTFPVLKTPNPGTVYQYQVLVGSGAEKRGLIKKVWHSKAVQSKLKNAHAWIFDGHTLAWSKEAVPGDELRIQVDLDAEDPTRKPRPGRTNAHRVIIKTTKQIDFASLNAYLKGTGPFTKECIEALNFMDHLLREYPSQSLTTIKRSFFARSKNRDDLGGGIEAFKGVYQSIRIAYNQAQGPALGPGCLSVNVDVANGTFWCADLLSNVVKCLVGATSDGDLIHKLRRSDGSWIQGFLELKRLRKLHVIVAHRPEKYVIDTFLKQNSNEFTFPQKKDGKVVGHPNLTNYFMTTYNRRLVHPEWPVVQMANKKSVLPMELIKIEPNERYTYKLNDRQTSAMIRVAVEPPQTRWGHIVNGINTLKWNTDPYHREYGLSISPNPTTVKGRLLQAPKVTFGARKVIEPRTSGRWNLAGVKFLYPNPIPLECWGVCVVQGRQNVDTHVVENFMTTFQQAYKAHGGLIKNAPVYVLGSSREPGKCCEDIWNKTGNKWRKRPQILVFILCDRDAVVYGRIKRSAECRYGVVSQCMQLAHAQKAQPQYISNVLMKFNAKLGGVTARAVGATSHPEFGAIGDFGKGGTVIIGCDVSHGAPGSSVPSMAAMTVSMDRLATRYAAACNVNGHRVEMVTPGNIRKLLEPLLQYWIRNVNAGNFPSTIMYFRDGVSEGQFAHVIEQEVDEIKKMLRTPRPDWNGKVICVVASKRHHVRFFPKDNNKDRNSNPLPGTLVESGVTHPFERDFYLCAHAALKGTARPVHYNVLLNETTMSTNQLYTLIYEHSYQYIRSTTPVSLFPAVYYAHLASNRGIHHDKDFANANSAERASKAKTETISSDPPLEYEDLMPMPDDNLISKSMWYV